TLTPAGSVLLQGAADIVQRIHHVTKEVRRTGKGEDATLLFAATHALSFTFLPTWVKALERAAPLGPLRLVSDSMQGCETLMLQGDVQFLLCHAHAAATGRFTPPDFSVKVVGTDRLEPFCAPDADGAPLWTFDGGDSGDIPYLAYSPQSGLGRILDATVLHRPAATRLKTVVTSHLAAALLSLARDGRGMAWLPRAVVADDLAAGRLTPAAGTDWNVEMDIVVVRSPTPQTLAAENFWSLIDHATPG
ncbi:MAG: LysR substrate-binding domain-containing protein, partial [Brevundimonas sp.]